MLKGFKSIFLQMPPATGKSTALCYLVNYIKRWDPAWKDGNASKCKTIYLIVPRNLHWRFANNVLRSIDPLVYQQTPGESDNILDRLGPKVVLLTFAELQLASELKENDGATFIIDELHLFLANHPVLAKRLINHSSQFIGVSASIGDAGEQMKLKKTWMERPGQIDDMSRQLPNVERLFDINFHHVAALNANGRAQKEPNRGSFLKAAAERIKIELLVDEGDCMILFVKSGSEIKLAYA